MHLKSRRERKKDDTSVGKSGVGMDYRTVSFLCSLEGGYSSFQRRVNLDAQKQ